MVEKNNVRHICFICCDRVCSATTPHPSSPEEGTTLDARGRPPPLARTPLPAGEGLGERPLHQRAEVMKPAGAHDGAAQEGNTFGRGTGSSGGY